MTDEHWRTLWARAQHLLDARRPDRALPVIAELIGARPECASSRLLLVSALYQSDKKEKALKEARSALALEPENTKTLHWIAMLSPSQDERNKASERALALEPNNASLHAQRAFVLMSSRGKALLPKKLEVEIEAAARRALELDPESTVAFRYLTNTLATQNRVAEAEDATKRWLELAPTDAAAHRMMGFLKTKRGGWNHASTLWRSSLEIDPTDKWTQHQLHISDARGKGQRQFETIFRLAFGWMPRFVPLPILFLALGVGCYGIARGFALPIQEALFLLGFNLLVIFGFAFSLVMLPLAARAYEPLWRRFFPMAPRDES